jgi:hypothetical protein
MRGRRPHEVLINGCDVSLLRQVAQSSHLPFYQVQRARVLLAMSQAVGSKPWPREMAATGARSGESASDMKVAERRVSSATRYAAVAPGVFPPFSKPRSWSVPVSNQLPAVSISPTGVAPTLFARPSSTVLFPASVLAKSAGS